MLPFLLFSTVFLLSQADELISTRCQAKCLHDMEIRHKDNAEMRRNFKHHLVNMCKDDHNCSSCTVPCREDFVDVTGCKKDACKNAVNKESCESSCEFLQKIYSEKPGACPKIKEFSNYECTAECHLDGDCSETQKCCSYGCSRKCASPKSQDSRLLPVPTGISVQERKRKRSAVVRWVLKQLSPEQANANSNLYVVQWRWSIHAEEGTMTEWQTVVVKNKMYAILKHLLSPGRFYQFRVGAVNVHGSLGFSTPSAPFKLSKEARAPNAPKQVSLGDSKLVGRLWTQTVQWTPPASDLPIKNYQVSWALSDAAEADTFEDQMRKQAVIDSTHQMKRALDDDEGLFALEERDRTSVIVPSHSTHTDIAGLETNSVYIVEVHATVESTEGELHGEKGIVFVRTGSTSDDVRHYDISTNDSNDHEKKTTVNLRVPTMRPQPTGRVVETAEVQTPYLEGTQLQTTINWLNSQSCTPNREAFVVRMRKESCDTSEVDGIWHDIKVTECVALLRGLSFRCTYSVEVARAGESLPVVVGSFRTVECESTPATSGSRCDEVIEEPLNCNVFGLTVACAWNRMHPSTRGETVIGYRVVLSSTSRDLNNITINPPQLRDVRFENLEQNTNYRLDVQPITNRGLGEVTTTTFHTGIHETIGMIGEDDIQRFPGGEIIELPLEAAGSAAYSFGVCSLLIPIVAYITCN